MSKIIKTENIKCFTSTIRTGTITLENYLEEYVKVNICILYDPAL